MPTELERRILVHAPTSKDSTITCQMLAEKGMACVACGNVESLVHEMDRGIGALILAEEALVRDDLRPLVEFVHRQPPWSDLPIMLVTRHGSDSPAVNEAATLLGNVTLLERPISMTALVSAAQGALRARRRQFQARDLIIAREEAARALEESELRFRTLVEQVKDYAIFMMDRRGRATSWNEGVRRLLGYGHEEFVGLEASRLFTPEDAAQGVPEAELNEAACTGAANDDRWMRRKDGSRFWASGVTTALRDRSGAHIGFTKVMRDLTARMQAEESLRQADRRKDEFLATLAHELRNPLAPLRNSVNILQLTASDHPATVRLCDTMERQLNHLVRLVDDLLEVSRITRGKIELRKERIELATIARNAIETSRPVIEAAKVQLAISLPQESIIVDGDSTRLGQVFSNLLNNAAKYTNEGGQIWFAARREGDEAIISIRDTGIGIPVDVLPHVFDMFMQVDRTTNRSQGGLGIGLTLVRSLVKLHGGEVTARSAGPGSGSEFIVRLPIAHSQPESTASAPTTKRTKSITSRRVLVVDDNIDSATSLGMLLKYLGAHVQVVNDGEAALSAVERYRPEFVLLDIGMPGMDGLEVARRIRMHDEYDHIKLIALTGWGQEGDRRRTEEAGFDHHLVKPADVTALQALLQPSH